MSDWSGVTRPLPVPDQWTKPFWDAAKYGRLELQRCQDCGHFQHPPYPTCLNCMSINLKFEPVGGSGTIYAYTFMHHTGDKRFASAVPSYGSSSPSSSLALPFARPAAPLSRPSALSRSPARPTPRRRAPARRPRSESHRCHPRPKQRRPYTSGCFLKKRVGNLG